MNTFVLYEENAIEFLRVMGQQYWMINPQFGIEVKCKRQVPNHKSAIFVGRDIISSQGNFLRFRFETYIDPIDTLISVEDFEQITGLQGH